jgi:hypothetical protein
VARHGTGHTIVTLPADPVAASLAISVARFGAGSCATAVIVAADALTLAIAAPLAAVLDAPLLATSAGNDAALDRELDRLGATRLVTVGPRLDDRDYERIGDVDDLGPLSVQVAHFVRAYAGTVRAFAIGDTDAARHLAGPVGAAAAARRFPVMVGTAAARQGATEGERRAAVTYLVGMDAIAGAATVPGGFPLPAPTPKAAAERLAQLLRADADSARTAPTTPTTPTTAAVSDPAIDPTTTAALAGSGGPVLFALPDPPPDTTFVLGPPAAAHPAPTPAG